VATQTEVRQIVGDFALHIAPDVSLDYARSTVDTWEALLTVACERQYHHEGCDISVHVDWAPVHALLAEQLRDSLDLLSDPPPGMVKEWVIVPLQPNDRRLYHQKTSLLAQVQISGQNLLANAGRYAGFFVETYLYDLFLILNLALPGSADFFNVIVPGGDYRPERLGLSAFYWWPTSRAKDQWPPVHAIDLKVVAAWFYGVRRGFAQVPESSVERAMFAILHMCRSGGRPEDIIWLFYAFESLFQTRAGENFSALLERLELVLQPNSEQDKQLRKQLRAMYDFRSSFVHGGFNVIHPMHHEGMDKRVDDSYGRIIDLSEYGLKILLACLQRYVQEGWREVRYRTTVEPISDEF
jgi:hypothetical protein